MSKLFRDEVLGAQRAEWLGTIRIGRKPGFAVVTAVALVLAAALVAYALYGEITRKTRLTGLLVPAAGTLNLSSPAAGTLVDVRVKEGEAVGPQQVLMIVGTDRRAAQGETAALVAQTMEQRRATLLAERGLAELQTRQRQAATADRERSLASETRQFEGELESVRRRIELAKKSVERYAELARSGFVSEIQVQQRQEELIDLTSRESGAERNLIAVRREAQSLRSEQSALANALAAQRVQIDRQLATLTQEGTENTARRELVVVAPQGGTVTALNAKRGQTVQSGQTLAALVPSTAAGESSPLQAHLYAPSRAAGFIDKGQTVWIRYAAYPYQKFGMAKGAIESVSRTPIDAADLPPAQATGAGSEPLYRVTVSLASQSIRTYGDSQPLKAGMALEADAVQERRRIWEWVLEPVLAASGLGQALADRR